AAQSPRAPINTLNELEAALLDCWVPPPIEQSRPGMITFQSGDASDAERASYRTAVAETLKRCASLPFTEAFGNGMAGEPLACASSMIGSGPPTNAPNPKFAHIVRQMRLQFDQSNR